MLEALLSIIIAALVILPMRMVLVTRERAKVEHRRYRDKFYEVASNLVQDDDVDEHVLRTIRKMSADIDQPISYARVNQALDEVETEVSGGRYGGSVPMPVPERLWNEWESLVFSYLLAVSYCRPVAGLFLRGKLAKALDPSLRRRTAEPVNRQIYTTIAQSQYEHTRTQTASA